MKRNSRPGSFMIIWTSVLQNSNKRSLWISFTVITFYSHRYKFRNIFCVSSGPKSVNYIYFASLSTWETCVKFLLMHLQPRQESCQKNTNQGSEIFFFFPDIKSLPIWLYNLIFILSVNQNCFNGLKVSCFLSVKIVFGSSLLWKLTKSLSLQRMGFFYSGQSLINVHK